MKQLHDLYTGLSLRALTASLDFLKSVILDRTQHPGQAAYFAFRVYRKAANLEQFATGKPVKKLTAGQFEAHVDPIAQSVWKYGDPRYASEFQNLKKKFEDQIWEQQIAKETMQFVGHESLQLAFGAAVKIVNAAAGKPNIKRAFINAFEIYSKQLQFIKMVKEQGIDVTLNMNGADPKWYHMTEQDLYNTLTVKAKRQLKKEGIQYEKH
ncbi:hypothetical protein [Zoogloea sp.]|uniref:hypothetical protein n=1 Tax=Zoogloea sp. TaxID=49181 RepID=UPI0014155E6F|nr:MAG: hypothetical protein F9K15_13340 [Zoogloea sp.]